MSTVVSEYSVSKPTQQFLDRVGSLWINGQWKSAQSGETFDVYNPATGEVIARCAGRRQGRYRRRGSRRPAGVRERARGRK